jgi:oxygen-independent coproporphyrinogen-3 oxidase
MRALWDRYGKAEQGVPEDGVEVVASEVASTSLAPFFDAYVRGVEATGAPPRAEEHLTALDRLNEHLLLRLRTRDGLSLTGFRRRSGMLLEEYSHGGLKRMLEWGLLDVAGDTVRLTREGLCVADRVIAELLRMA